MRLAATVCRLIELAAFALAVLAGSAFGQSSSLLLVAPEFGHVEALSAADPAKAVITDGHGNPVPVKMPLGEAVVFSARRSIHGGDPQAVRWLISPPERDARKYVSQDGLEVFVPTGLEPVTITAILAVAIDSTVDVATISVQCGDGPRPPPDPPKPEPPTPTAKHLKIVVLEDAVSPSPTAAPIVVAMRSRSFSDELKAAGHSWLHVALSDDHQLAKPYVAMLKQQLGVQTFPAGAAYMLIVDAQTDGLLYRGPLISFDDVKNKIAIYQSAR